MTSDIRLPAVRVLENFIDGRWVPTESETLISLVDPSTEGLIARMPIASIGLVDAAVSAAQGAASAWGARPLEERLDRLGSVADAIEQAIPELAAIEAAEMGRPVAIGEEWIASGLAGFRQALALALEYPFAARHGNTTVMRHPLGVAALITPWNFPTNVILAGLGPLLAAGNTVVLKPSEKSPLSAVRLIELFGDLPAGVVNLVLGDGSTGAMLTAHDSVSLTQFTGSVRAGRSVATESGRRLRRVLLELGGKDPVIIDDGVDPKAVAMDVARGAFVNSGQICTSMERIYVHRNVADAFLTALVAEARSYPFIDPQTHGPGIGPMVDAGQRQVVAAHVDDATAKGARVLAGGVVPEGRGYYYPATVLVDVDESMTVMQQETFGPIAPVRVVGSFDEGLELAKRSDYGLAATVYTNSPAHVRAAGDLPAGIIWINRWQGAGEGISYEPARDSGVGTYGHLASFDAATRATSVLHNVLTGGAE